MPHPEPSSFLECPFSRKRPADSQVHPGADLGGILKDKIDLFNLNADVQPRRQGEGGHGYTEPGCRLAVSEDKTHRNYSTCDGATPAQTENCCGPWLGADLEGGMYYGGGEWGDQNERNKPLRHDFVSLMLRGERGSFVLKGGDATQGQLATMYSGPRPYDSQPGRYNPMKKQGAIILGTGGDQSNSDRGNFYEGYMTAGATSDATDDAVQANILAVGYTMEAGENLAQA